MSALDRARPLFRDRSPDIFDDRSLGGKNQLVARVVNVFLDDGYKTLRGTMGNLKVLPAIGLIRTENHIGGRLCLVRKVEMGEIAEQAARLCRRRSTRHEFPSHHVRHAR